MEQFDPGRKVKTGVMIESALRDIRSYSGSISALENRYRHLNFSLGEPPVVTYDQECEVYRDTYEEMVSMEKEAESGDPRPLVLSVLVAVAMTRYIKARAEMFVDELCKKG